MTLSLEVLGFAGAAPLDGACSSYLVTGAGATVLLDCGPGTLERLWRRALLDRLDAIVISHMRGWRAGAGALLLTHLPAARRRYEGPVHVAHEAFAWHAPA